MRINIRQKLFLFSFMIVAVNGILGYAVYKSNQRLLDSQHRIQHLGEEMYQTDRILSIAKDIENTSRGFIITNNNAFLEPLSTAKKTVFVAIGQLKQLTGDNKLQQRQIDSINAYMVKRLDFSLKMAKLRSEHELTSNAIYAYTMQGKYYTDRIRQIIIAIRQEVRASLKQQNYTNEYNIAVFNKFLATIFILIAGFNILLIIAIGKYLLQNKEKEIQSAELIIVNNELKLAEIERTKMVNDLMLRNNILEQFAYIISHNLRSPVANIIGASSALNDADLSAGDRDMLNKAINTSVLRLDSVVQDLNHILQIKDSTNETKEVVVFSDLVNDIKFSIKNLVDKYAIEIKYDFSEANEYFTLKPYLYSIFYNLISNSVKYRRPDIETFIKVESHRIKNMLQLVFTDNGMGIDLEKNRDQVFGLYRRFHPDIEGKGMGLYMVKTQVETLGGKIYIHSEENKGTRFTIEFEAWSES
jgi:signal transduction histidine kinase